MSWVHEWYQIIRFIHIVAIISWMAGLLYLPRLYVYHATVEVKGREDHLLQVMERRLLRVIINPAMVVSVISGLLLVHAYMQASSGPIAWFHLKATAIVGLLVVHGMCAVIRKQFIHSANRRTARWFRVFNEVPTMLMIIIVYAVVVKPF